MAVLGTAFAGTWAAVGGGSKSKKATTPPINAGSSDEEKFIKYVVASEKATATFLT